MAAPPLSRSVVAESDTRANLHRFAQLLMVGAPQLVEEPGVPFMCGDMELDEDARTVRVAGRPVVLTFTEFEALSALLRHQDKAVSHTELTPHLAGDSSSSKAARAYVRRMREKLGDGHDFAIERCIRLATALWAQARSDLSFGPDGRRTIA